MKLALLLCDTPIDTVVAKHGDYSRIFSTILTETRPKSIPSFNINSFDVVHEQSYPSDAELDSYDGIIITGSAASAYEDKPWITTLVAYISRIAAAKPHIKIIGLCFGHQIVARALGGECVPNGGRWEVGVTSIALTEIGKKVFGVDSVINIQEMHRDHVPSLPPSFQLLGSTSVCPIQGMVRYYPDGLDKIHVFTVQGHPEFTASIVSLMVDRRASTGVLDSDTTLDARRRVDWQNDGKKVWGAVWKVLDGEL